jgi:hypothetical protein
VKQQRRTMKIMNGKISKSSRSRTSTKSIRGGTSARGSYSGGAGRIMKKKPGPKRAAGGTRKKTSVIETITPELSAAFLRVLLTRHRDLGKDAEAIARDLMSKRDFESVADAVLDAVTSLDWDNAGCATEVFVRALPRGERNSVGKRLIKDLSEDAPDWAEFLPRALRGRTR